MASTRVSGMVTPGAVVGLGGGIHSGLGLSDVALMDGERVGPCTQHYLLEQYSARRP